MKQLKKEFKGLILSNGLVKDFKTNDITPEMIAFYEKMGFAHIFEEMNEVKETKKIERKPKKLSSLEIVKKEVKNYTKNK